MIERSFAGAGKGEGGITIRAGSCSTENKNELFVNEPLISSYPELGHLFSMLDLENESVWEWIYCNFIHILTLPNGFTTFKDHWNYLRNCPFLRTFSYSVHARDNIPYKSVKELIIRSIDSGYFISIPVNYFYISSTEYYQKKDFFHVVLVYGYDLEENAALTADNINFGKYSYEKYSLDDFDIAYNNYSAYEEKDSLDIVIYKRFESNTPKFDIRYLKKELELYANPYYVNIWEALCVNLDSVLWEGHWKSSGRHGIDIRPYSIFYEHKIIMEKRVEYLYHHTYLADQIHLRRIADLKKRYLIIRNQIIKYNLNFNEKLLESVQSGLKCAAEQERRFISGLLDGLEGVNPL